MSQTDEQAIIPPFEMPTCCSSGWAGICALAGDSGRYLETIPRRGVLAGSLACMQVTKVWGLRLKEAPLTCKRISIKKEIGPVLDGCSFV